MRYGADSVCVCVRACLLFMHYLQLMRHFLIPYTSDMGQILCVCVCVCVYVCVFSFYASSATRFFLIVRKCGFNGVY